MIKYFNSGLYGQSFYRTHELDWLVHESIAEDIAYNEALLTSYYKDYYKDGIEYEDEDELQEQVREIFWEKLSYWTTYFVPLVFDEEIALRCGLTPFTYREAGMLAYFSDTMSSRPVKLDAYQLLTDNTIDQNSSFFSEAGVEYFEYVVGKEVVAEMQRIILL